MIIDTFFFRSTAMIPSPQKMVVMLETPVSAAQARLKQLDTISGIIDYTVIVAASNLASESCLHLVIPHCVTRYTAIYITTPPKMNQRYGNAMTAFLAAEAKATVSSGPLDGHLPQVLLELVACAKHLGYGHLVRCFFHTTLFCG